MTVVIKQNKKNNDGVLSLTTGVTIVCIVSKDN